jgi:hypothetical protein
MLVGGAGLLISLPAEELRGMNLSASLFPPSELNASAISDELRWALQLATNVCTVQQARVLVVARPEIFTHGLSLTWLQDQLMGVKDHLCVSDGTAVRPIHGMRNHLFLYRRASHRHAVAFERLIGWVPELLDSLHSQVNTCISVRSGKRVICPPTVLMQANAETPEEIAFLGYRHHATLETSVRRTASARMQRLPAKARKITYVPLTDYACRNPVFMRAVAKKIRASQRLLGSGVVIRLPTSGVEERLELRLSATLTALRKAGGMHPLKPGALVFATGDPNWPAVAAPDLAIDLFADSSYEFWRHSSDYFAAFRKLELCGEGNLAQQKSWQGLLNLAADRQNPDPRLREKETC